MLGRWRPSVQNHDKQSIDTATTMLIRPKKYSVMHPFFLLHHLTLADIRPSTINIKLSLNSRQLLYQKWVKEYFSTQIGQRQHENNTYSHMRTNGFLLGLINLAPKQRNGNEVSPTRVYMAATRWYVLHYFNMQTSPLKLTTNLINLHLYTIPPKTDKEIRILQSIFLIIL